jgi:hypothetical protein
MNLAVPSGSMDALKPLTKNRPNRPNAPLDGLAGILIEETVLAGKNALPSG